MTYSLKFRETVLAKRAQEKWTLAKTAEVFDIGSASIEKWSKNIAPKQTKNRPFTKLDIEALKEDIEQFPLAYNRERGERLGVSENCIMYALKKLRVVYIRPLSSNETNSRRKFCFLPDKALNGGAVKLLEKFY